MGTERDDTMMKSAQIAVAAKAKLHAIRRHHGSRPVRFLDLFAGCGGLALGFARAGGTSVGGVELDPLAAQSYATNFHRTLEGDELANHSIGRDITLPSNEPAALL